MTLALTAAPQGEWQGFPQARHPDGRLTVYADYWGSDDNPTPLCSLRQIVSSRVDDTVELTARELEWLVAIAPRILDRMKARP